MIHLVGIDGITNIFIHGPIGTNEELAGGFSTLAVAGEDDEIDAIEGIIFTAFSSLSLLF